MARRSEYKVLNMRVTPVARELIAGIANHMGVSQTAAFETIVRKAAREEGIILAGQPEERGARAVPTSVEAAMTNPPTMEQFYAAMARIKARGPLSHYGLHASDEDLTSEAMYADHD